MILKNIYTAYAFIYLTSQQQAVPLKFVTNVNDKALIVYKTELLVNKFRGRIVFKNVNISNRLFFFERCSLITATSFANKLS